MKAILIQTTTRLKVILAYFYILMPFPIFFFYLLYRKIIFVKRLWKHRDMSSEGCEIKHFLYNEVAFSNNQLQHCGFMNA